MTDQWGYTDARRAASVGAFGDWHSADLWKHNDDLRRYDQIIRDTEPNVIIECGTNTGASASWMVSAIPGRREVLTIDIDCSRWNPASSYGVTRFGGSSTDPRMANRIRDLMHYWSPDNARVMVSLDSDHSAAHVRREIELYAPLVTPGCYLVVEDGIFSWLRDDQWRAHGCVRPDGTKLYDGTPLDAIADWRATGRSDYWWEFERDEQIEFAYPVTMNPAGWWRRVNS